jgi:hypothetical protein
MAASWRNNPRPSRTNRVRQSELQTSAPGFSTSFAERGEPDEERIMKAHAIFASLAGALLLTTMADSALAQAKYYPDGTNCSLLSDAELVQCQNQLYARQLESGVSNQAAEPVEVPSSHIEGNEAGQSDFVPGAEGAALPDAGMPAAAPTVIYSLPGPEGTRVTIPTE